MEQAAGFTVTLPEIHPDWVTETIYRVIPGELVEVIYLGAENELRVRIAMGSRDISGVYDSDPGVEKDVALGENQIHLKGMEAEDGSLTVLVSTWTTEAGRTYSVTSTAGIPEAQMLEQIQAIA